MSTVIARGGFALVWGVVCFAPLVAAADEKKEPEKPAGAPPADVIKAEMQKFYGTSSKDPQGRPHYEYTIEYNAMRYGQSYEGTHRADGVPPNTKTTVYPVKLEMVLSRKTVSSGEVKKEKIVGQYGFFKDSFGDWTWRLKESQREDIK